MASSSKNRNSFRWIALLGILALFVLLRARFGAQLTLENLKEQRESLVLAAEAAPLEYAGVFMSVYVLMAAFAIPGAAILTLGAGAVFGLVRGVLLVSFASSIGATFALLLARYLFRDLVRARFRDRIDAVNEGVRREGAFYLLALRLLPVVPFFVVNVLMSVTSIPVVAFYLISQIGMLPATVVYVNAGTRIAEISSLRDIATPGVLGSFAALALLPFFGKLAINAWRKRRAFRGYRKPPRFDYNLVVIGAGSAGLVASYIAATARAKVALIEKERMGGDCLNTGCVPSKAMIRSAKLLHLAKRAGEFGLRIPTAEADFPAILARVRKVISKIEPHDSVARYSSLGVECLSGDARVVSPWEVEVAGRRISTRALVLATGASPAVPPIPGLEETGYLTSDTVWSLPALPRRLLILGGGPIGCELAQCFARFGADVTLVERAAVLLEREDADVSEAITRRFVAEGIRVRTSHEARSFMKRDGRKYLRCNTAAGETEIEFDEVLLALGRKARVKGFGLEELGVRVAPRGTIETDEFLATNFPNIFVCGDAAGPYQFTHVAAHQAWYASVNALFGAFKKFRADYRVIPWATFTDPEVARVGLSEKEARAAGVAHEVTRYGIDDLDRAIADGSDHGFIKVLTPSGSDRILGVTVVGEHAGDLIQEFVFAMKQGLGLNRILSTIHIYPTFVEANRFAAGNWKRAHAPERVLRWSQRYLAWLRS